MDSHELMNKLLSDPQGFNQDLVQPLRQILEDYIQTGCQITDLVLLASFVYDLVEQSLHAADPYDHFEKHKPDYDSTLTDVGGKALEFSEYLFEILVEVKKVFSNPKTTSQAKTSSIEIEKKINTGKSTKEKEQEKKIFKELYMKAYRNNKDYLTPDIACIILDTLISGLSDNTIQDELSNLLGYQNVEIVSELITNRKTICDTAKASLAKANYSQFGPTVSVTRESAVQYQKSMKKVSKRQGQQVKSSLDMLRALGFDDNFLKQDELSLKETSAQENEYTFNNSAFQKKALPINLTRTQEKNYIEYVLPAPIKNSVPKDHLIPIDAFKEWCRPAFAGITNLNAMQTKVFDTAYFSNDNILVSAPTGAGKTNIALMAVIKVLENSMDRDGVVNPDIKIIYVAPMKALASEVTEKFSQKLKYLGLLVRELTGDMQLTKSEFAKTHMIVTTPEKWDVVTRKSDSNSIKVKLLILDEIHLLDEDRGPVLEILVARTLRLVETSQETIRIVGLSATLPNYKDVAEFLRVPESGCFYFGGEYRPVPLEQRFIGANMIPNLQKQQALILEICYNKVLEQVKQDNQVMIFVHSRRDTSKTCMSLRDMAINNNELHHFECCYSLASRKEVEKSKNRDVKFLFESGFGIHNAGMVRKDRNLSEKLFKDKNIKVLVCTATLAWGVNLPAHAVIIKGTDIYDSTIGNFKDIGILDVQQIFGRAGRPDYDTSGLAMIITLKDKVDQYVQMLSHQRPIESRLLGHLKDSLNAEVSLGTVNSIQDAVRWVKYTYFFVRLLKNPLFYGFSIDEVKKDNITENLTKRILDSVKLIHNYRMVRFDEKTQTMSTTAIGRIASNFYIKSQSIEIYVDKLQFNMSDEQLYSMFCESHEFQQLKLRDDENEELYKLAMMASENWIKISKEDVATPYGKVMSLIYAYLAEVQVDTFSLVSDMGYIIQNGSRILRALYEMCLKKNWAFMSEKLLTISRNIDKRLMVWDSPLKQFTTNCNIGGFTSSTNSAFFQGGYLSYEIFKTTLELGLSIEKIQELSLRELTVLMRREESANTIKKYIKLLPMLDIDYKLHPISGSITKVTLEFSVLFTWKDRWHGNSLVYWIWVDDGNDILHYESFVLHYKSLFKPEKPSTTFAIPLSRYKSGDLLYIRCLCDRWTGVDMTIPIEIDVSLLPKDTVQHTELLNLNPLPKTVLQNPSYESLYKFEFFNPIQTQTFHTLYYHDTNVLVGAPTGSGKTITAEIAMFRVFNNTPEKKIIYIAPLKALAKERIKDWTLRLGALNKKVFELTGDYTPDIASLNIADVLITTPEKWDGISRNWQHRGYVQRVGLVIIDEIHLLGQDRGPVLEVIVSRMRFMSTQINSNIRIIGLSTALANAQDLAGWLGIDALGFFNFKPSVRPVPLQVHVDGFPEKMYCPRMATMNRPAFNAIKSFSANKPVLIFVASRRQTRLTAFDLIALRATEFDTNKGFLKIHQNEMDIILTQVNDENLKYILSFGIGLHHAGLSENDRKIVEDLFVTEKIQILVTTTTLAWGVNFPAHLVIIKGSEYYDAKEKKYVDFPITDILQMMGRAGRPQFDDNGVVCIYVLEEKRAFLKTFLYQPFPVESSLSEKLNDHINAEIAAGTLTSKASCINYLTWTYFYRRLTKNPGYYNLLSLSAEAVNMYLIKMVDKVLEELSKADCIEIEDDYIQPLPMGHVASFYYITCNSIKYLKDRLETQSLSFEDIISVLSHVEEFAELPVRHNEEHMNEELARLVPYSVNMSELESPHTKTNLLLQAHLSRVKLPIIDYLTDTKLVLDQSVRLLNGMVDISSQVGSLNNTLKIATLLQMLTQGQWYYDSTLINLPGLTIADIKKLHSIGISSLCQLVEIDINNVPDLFNKVGITLSKQDKINLHKCLKSLPVFNISFKVVKDRKEEQDSLWGEQDDFGAGGIVNIEVKLENLNKDASRKAVMSKTGRLQDIGLWAMIGCKNNDRVLAIKKIQFPKKPLSSYFMTIQVPNNPKLALYLIHDAYLGLDQEYNMN
jgi:activating signal cointegrator complex subunit 3